MLRQNNREREREEMEARRSNKRENVNYPTDQSITNVTPFYFHINNKLRRCVRSTSLTFVPMCSTLINNNFTLLCNVDVMQHISKCDRVQMWMIARIISSEINTVTMIKPSRLLSSGGYYSWKLWPGRNNQSPQSIRRWWVDSQQADCFNSIFSSSHKSFSKRCTIWL